MSPRVRFGVSLEKNLLRKFDEEIQKKGYTNRSKAIGDLIRGWLIEEHWKTEEKKGIGVISLLYDHEIRKTMDALVELQHNYTNMVIASTHVHLDHTNCLEVIIVRGKLSVIKKIADGLAPIRGVKQVKLILTTQEADQTNH